MARRIVIPYTPMEHQKQLHNCKAKRVVAVTGRQIGKTVCSTNEIIKRAVIKPKSRNWYVTNDYRQAKRNVWDLFKQYTPLELLAKKPNESELKLDLKNGSKIELIGVENAESLRGAAVDFIVCDEYADFPRDVWPKVLRPMFSTTNGDAWFMGTPKGLGNDLYTKFQEEKEVFRFPACEVIGGQVTNLLSRYTSREELQEAYDDDSTPTKEVFSQEYLAEFTRPSGTVYSEWPLENFTIVPYDDLLPVHVTFDFGVNDPTSIIWIQPTGSEYRVIDYYEATDANVSHYVSVIRAKPYKTPELYTGDAAGKARTMTTGTSVIDEFAQAGIHIRTSDGLKIEDQIRETHRHIKSLYVDDKLTRFRDCLLNYRYPEKNENLRDQSNEKPIHDEFSHAMRALEYYFVNYKGKAQPVPKYDSIKWQI